MRAMQDVAVQKKQRHLSNPVQVIPSDTASNILIFKWQCCWYHPPDQLCEQKVYKYDKSKIFIGN